MSDYQTTVRELTLMLLYLTSWIEKERGTSLEYRWAWKNHRFEILDQLDEEDCIRGSKRGKSVFVTEDGVKQAKELLAKYGISEDWD